jgi:hypothetical protein
MDDLLGDQSAQDQEVPWPIPPVYGSERADVGGRSSIVSLYIGTAIKGHFDHFDHNKYR